MDPYDEETAAKYMMDAINEDTRVNAAEQFGAEEARTADSLLKICPEMVVTGMMTLPRRPSGARSSTYLNYAW